MQVPYDTRSRAPHRAEPLTLSGTVAGDGTLTLTAPQVPDGWRWLLNYLTVTTSGTAEPTVDVYVSTSDLRNLLDGTAEGLSAVAPYVPPRVITTGEQLVFVWQGATAGATGSVRIEYDVEPA